MVEKLLKNQAIVFPEESYYVIQEILKKYKLYREPREKFKKMAQEIREAKTFEEKQEISEKQPERKLARAIKEKAEGKITLEEFSRQLQQIFKVPEPTAQKIAKDLEKNVLVFAKKVFTEKEDVSPIQKPFVKPLPATPSPQEIPEILPHPKPETAPSSMTEEEKPEASLEEKKQKKPDTYRESIE